MQVDFENPQVQKVAKVKCLRDLLFHIRYFSKVNNKRKFIVAEPHLRIAAALERVLRGELKRLIINMPPRYGKTEVAVKGFIAHALALNPAAKFIHLSYGDDIALDNSESIKGTVQSDAYQALFPEVQIKKDAKAKNKWYTTQGGGVLARAAGGQVTGFGAGAVDSEETDEQDDIDEFLEGMGITKEVTPLETKMKFNGAIIIDDPIKPEDADQETIRNKVNERFDSTIRTRVNSRNTPIIVIMHRLHPEDLAGYLQREDEADSWEVLSMEALIRDENGQEVQEREYDTDGMEIVTTLRYRALWAHKHTVTELLALKKANDIVFERQYQQNPAPKSGLLFPLSQLKFYDHAIMNNSLIDPDYTLVCADPANEGGDDFAGAPFKLLDTKIYLPEVLYNTDGADMNELEIEKMVFRHRTSHVAIEGVLGWKETAMRIREGITRRGYKNEFRIVRPRKQKHSRIYNRSAFIKNNVYFRKDWAQFPQYAKFMRVLTTYLRIQEPGKMNKHDDAPDLLEMACAYFEKNFPHLWGLPATPK